MVGDSQSGFGAEESLILHADVVRAFNNNWSSCVYVAMNDLLAADDIAIWVNRFT